MALNIPFRNAYYRFASSYSFLFFISWSLWWSLYAIWLKGHLGLTGTELGTVRSGGCGRGKKRGFYRSFQGSKLLGFRHIYCGDVVFL